MQHKTPLQWTIAQSWNHKTSTSKTAQNVKRLPSKLSCKHWLPHSSLVIGNKHYASLVALVKTENKVLSFSSHSEYERRKDFHGNSHRVQGNKCKEIGDLSVKKNDSADSLNLKKLRATASITKWCWIWWSSSESVVPLQ